MVLSTDRGPSTLKKAWNSYKEALDEGGDRMAWLGERWLSFIVWVKFHNQDGERGWFDMETRTVHIVGGDRNERELGQLERTIGYFGALLALMAIVGLFVLQFDVLDPTPPTRADTFRLVSTVVLMWVAFLALHVGEDIEIEREGDD